MQNCFSYIFVLTISVALFELFGVGNQRIIWRLNSKAHILRSIRNLWLQVLAIGFTERVQIKISSMMECVKPRQFWHESVPAKSFPTLSFETHWWTWLNLTIKKLENVRTLFSYQNNTVPICVIFATKSQPDNVSKLKSLPPPPPQLSPIRVVYQISCPGCNSLCRPNGPTFNCSSAGAQQEEYRRVWSLQSLSPGPKNFPLKSWKSIASFQCSPTLEAKTVYRKLKSTLNSRSN